MDISVDENNGTVVGRDLNVTFTHVKSVPCINPYCDTVIPVVKANLRKGLCSPCFKDEEKNEKASFRSKPLSILLIMVFFGVSFFSLMAILIVSVAEIINKEVKNDPIFWVLCGLSLTVVFVLFYFGMAYEKISRKYKLEQPIFTAPEKSK